MIAAFVTFVTAIALGRIIMARGAGPLGVVVALAALVAVNAAIGFGLGMVLPPDEGVDAAAAAQQAALHGGLLALAIGGLAALRRWSGESEGSGGTAVPSLSPQRPRLVNGRLAVDVDSDHTAPPLNPLPWAVWLMALPMIGLEVLFSAGEGGLAGGNAGLGWRVDAVQHFAFSPDIMRAMIEARQYPVEGMWRLVSYPFVHGQLTHTVFVVAILLALGKFAGESFRGIAMLLVFFAASVAGALAMTAVPTIHQTLLGGYPAVYGMIGLFTFLLWSRLAGEGARRYRAFSMIGFLLLAQLLFGVLFGGGFEWVADLAGFATGFLLSFVLAPGALVELRTRLRQR